MAASSRWTSRHSSRLLLEGTEVRRAGDRFMRPSSIAVALLVLATVGCNRKQSLQTLMQQQADASCVKQLGAGWVAEGVEDKMPFGGSCRPVSDCAKASDLYDKCKIDYDALAKQYGGSSASPPPRGFVPETKTPDECKAYWKPIIDKVCKGGLQAGPIAPTSHFKATATPTSAAVSAWDASGNPVEVRCGLDANGHIVSDGKGGCIPPPPDGYIIGATATH